MRPSASDDLTLAILSPEGAAGRGRSATIMGSAAVGTVFSGRGPAPGVSTARPFGLAP